jgi:Zn-dependent protease
MAGGLLSCPACHRLVHADRLQTLSQAADQAEGAGEVSTALSHWRQALDLLPAGSRQHSQVQDKIAALSGRAGASAAPKSMPGWSKNAAGLGVLAVVLWKFKFVLVFLATKAKLLLMGLTNATTAFSMLASLGLYWTAWGWKFALGIVGMIYIHEMGHVAALQRYGIKASAPMFIPGFGAFVQMQQHPATPSEDAQVGLDGPWWGLGAAAAAAGVHFAAHAPFWGALAQAGGWLTLFNLTPFWQLDGSRAFAALSRPHRIGAALAIAAAWFATGEGLLLLLAVVAVIRAAGRDAPERGHPAILAQYALLIAISSALCLLRIAA